MNKVIVTGRQLIMWINSLVSPDVVMGEGISVGAQAIELRPTEKWSLYVGALTKRAKARCRNHLLLKSEF